MPLKVWTLSLLLLAVSTITRNEAFSPRWKQPFGVTDVLPCSSQSKVCKTSAGHGKNDFDWSYFTLSMSWPATFCLTQEDRKCEIPENIENWSIHGLWPSSGPGEGPENCNKKANFDSSLVKSIDNLTEYWPNLLVDEGHYCFWRHEWCTHGTCATNVSSVDDEFHYFEQAVELFKKFNPYSALSNSGITPSTEKNYSADAITLAIQKQSYVLPNLICYNHKGKVYLHEVHMCLNEALHIMNCPASKKSSYTKCDGNIQYPPIEHTFKN